MACPVCQEDYARLSWQAWEILKPYQEENTQKREAGGRKQSPEWCGGQPGEVLMEVRKPKWERWRRRGRFSLKKANNDPWRILPWPEHSNSTFCPSQAPLYYCSFTSFPQASSIQNPMLWAAACPLPCILNEPVPLLGAQCPPRTQIGEPSLLSVLTPHIRHFPNVCSAITQVFTSELSLTHSGPFFLCPSRKGLGTQRGWEPFRVERVFQALSAALYPPEGWDYKKSTFLPVNTLNSLTCTSVRAAEALALEQN